MTYYREERRPPEDVESLFECQMQSITGAGAMVRPHVHEYFEALYCLEGGFELNASGVIYPFFAGDMALIDPNEVHHTRAATPGNNRYLVIKFVPEALLYAERPVYEMKLLLPYLWSGGAHQKVFPKQALDQDGIGRLLMDIWREFEGRALGYEMAVRSGLCRLFLWVARTLHAESETQVNLDGAALMTLESAFAYIGRNFSQEISMEEVAAHCGMKYSAFSRFFAKYAQKSFPEYVTQVRLKEACILLATTGESITGISMAVGFSSTSYFIQCFRRMHGVAPGQFRRRFLAPL